MARCPKCRAINDPRSITCKRCGGTLGEQQTTGTQHRTGLFSEHGEFANRGLQNTNSERDEINQTPTRSIIAEEASSPFGENGVSESIWESDFTDAEPGNSAYDQLVSVTPSELETQSTTPAIVDTTDPGSSQRASVAVTLDTPRPFGRSPTLTGSVFMVRDSQEPPDTDIFLWVSRFLGLTLILEIILLVLTRAYQQLGVILIIGIFFVLLLFSRLLGGLFFFALFGFSRLLSPIFRSRNEMVPVRICRILDENQQEHIVRIKGRIIRGDIDVNDRVSIWGRWRDRTLFFRRGYNIRARSWIRLEGCYSWILALVLAILNLYLLFELHQIYPGITLGTFF